MEWEITEFKRNLPKNSMRERYGKGALNMLFPIDLVPEYWLYYLNTWDHYSTMFELWPKSSVGLPTRAAYKALL